jgi:hypothetical protein
MPGSPDTLAGGSYPFALLNSREHNILPTRGQIANVRKDMENQSWKFVRVLYQTQMESENPLQMALQISVRSKMCFCMFCLMRMVKS